MELSTYSGSCICIMAHICHFWDLVCSFMDSWSIPEVAPDWQRNIFGSIIPQVTNSLWCLLVEFLLTVFTAEIESDVEKNLKWRRFTISETVCFSFTFFFCLVSLNNWHVMMPRHLGQLGQQLTCRLDRFGTECKVKGPNWYQFEIRIELIIWLKFRIDLIIIPSTSHALYPRAWTIYEGNTF